MTSVTAFVRFDGEIVTAVVCLWPCLSSAIWWFPSIQDLWHFYARRMSFEARQTECRGLKWKGPSGRWLSYLPGQPKVTGPTNQANQRWRCTQPRRPGDDEAKIKWQAKMPPCGRRRQSKPPWKVSFEIYMWKNPLSGCFSHKGRWMIGLYKKSQVL